MSFLVSEMSFTILEMSFPILAEMSFGQNAQKKPVSILHYAKATRNLRRGGSYSQARGTVGSGLTPGSRLGRRTPEIPDPEPEIRKKPENPFPARFAL